MGGDSQDGSGHVHTVAQIVHMGVGLSVDSGPLPPGKNLFFFFLIPLSIRFHKSSFQPVFLVLTSDNEKPDYGLMI